MQQGSYVICINDRFDDRARKKLTRLPTKGKIYRIRRVIPNFDTDCDEDGVALEGIFGDWNIYRIAPGKEIFEEFHFRISRFREIDFPEPAVRLTMEKEHEETACLV